LRQIPANGLNAALVPIFLELQLGIAIFGCIFNSSEIKACWLSINGWLK